MSVSDWKFYYKLDNNYFNECESNMLYAPRVNPEGTVMCMDWSLNNGYQHDINRTQELLDFFFQREIKYYTVFKDYAWAPKLLDIQKDKIFLEWNQQTLNNLLFGDKCNLNDICPDWKDQLFNILQDIKDAGYYKMALYPHCFFFDRENKLKTFDFYGCVEIDYPYVERSKIEGMIGPDSGGRFNSATNDGLINFETFFKNTLQTHLGTIWPDNPFPEYYRRLFDENEKF